MRRGPRTAFSSGVRGALTTAGPLVTLVALLLADFGALVEGTALVGAALSSGAATTLAGLAIERRPRLGRVLVTAGIAAPALIAPQALVQSPTLTFILGMGGGGAVGVAWLSPFADASARVDRPAGRAVALRWSAYVSLVAWLGLRVTDLDETRAGLLASASCLGITLAYAIVWTARAWGAHPVRARFLAAATLLALVLAAPLATRPETALAVLAAVPVSAAVLAPGAAGWLSGVVEHPARLLVVTFLMLSAGGTIFLALPEAAADGASIGGLDAAFTAVSAVCVTGLVVVDTPSAFGPLGETIVLLLIQVGGLGIMTFYSAALSAFGGRLSIRHESAIAGALSIEDRGRLFGALGRILKLTFAAEGAGAVILFVAFLAGGEAAASAWWRAVFTSVSAFCNAGFALQTDSLVPYADDPVVLHTVALLIVLGGLSPAVIAAVPDLVRRRVVNVQARVVLAATGVLLVGGFAAFAAFEWTRTLADMPFATRLHNAWFQSVTLRTAGFNSVDMAATRPATQTMMVAMMFIGGSPGGTAGGAKTTTVAVMVLAVLAALRRRTEATAFGKRIAHRSVYKAAAVITMGLFAAIGALVAVELTQDLTLETAVFEVVSALGTVGLSTGGTAQLDGVGKVLIMLCMFAGRVGPLTLFLFFTVHGERPIWGYPEQEVDVG